MEDLSKHQLILLTLLVTFVTSIATGIITFTLLQEAPVEVTNTINRVVERTIETVAPSTVGGKETVREVQTVNEEQLVLNSIDKNTKSIVRYKISNPDGSLSVVGIGLVVSDQGYVALDSRSYTAGNVGYVVFPDGRSFSAEKVYNDADTGLVFIRLSMKGHESEKNVFTPITLGNSDNLKLGQSIIRLGGKLNNNVSLGHISELTNGDDGKTLLKIISDIKYGGSLPGSPLLNNAGEVVGVEASNTDSDSAYTFLPINSLKSSITKAVSELSK